MNKKYFFSILSLLSLSLNAHANVGEAYGLGSRVSALAGAGAGWGADAYSAYYNPAAISLMGEKRLLFAWSLVDIETRFRAINNVIVSNDYTADQVVYGNVDTSYRSTFGEALALSYKLLPNFYQLSFGATAFFPISHIAYIDTGEPFVPEYMFYRARTQRPQIEFGLSAEPFSGIHFGLGAHLAFSLTTNANILIQTDLSKPSTMRFASSLKPKLGPVLGIFILPYKLLGNLEDQDVITLGSVVRFPVTSNNNMNVNSGARVLGGLSVLDFNLAAVSALYYDPLTVEVGGTWKYLEDHRLCLQADYQFWSRYKSPALSIEKSTVEKGGILISAGKNAPFDFKNIFIPRIGHESDLSESIVIRAGYAYRPSIMKSLPTGAGNFLDPPKHMLNAGVGLKFKTFVGFNTPSNIDFHATYHKLINQHIVKDAGDERGLGTGNLKIGAPGYETGGSIFGGGATLSVGF